MKRKSHRKRSKRLKSRFKRLAAAVAGAAIMSSALLPGIPAATAHASAVPNAAAPPATAVSQVVKTPTGYLTRVTKDIKPQPAPRHKVSQTANKQIMNTAHAKNVHVKSVRAKPSREKAPANFNQALNVKATAYAPGPHDNGPWGNKTFSGTQIRPGVIAVDPNVIPLGSRVYIEYPDGSGTYAVAEDTGGAIKGNRIDIAMRSVDQAEKFGIQNVKVYVLD